ncbi:Ceg14 family Dot/Icm T4SS effector [uncultured Legionella sp.]|uniref:Ceg14 family Dot/Icm T4SS effector n=1 Tax=uncultured Legionella sp. TaxID=210934 RepID=UPI00262E0E75|nr:Ceg14 family Dot/Icm T4SS effector [uncultured Legionella sp.]
MKKIWNMIQSYNKLAQDISSSDLPSDDQKNAILVKLTQDFTDITLIASDKTWLDKILEISIHTKKTGFGNCQEKAFFGFAALVLESQQDNSLIHTLRLATFDNHFIVIVNEAILMDPWLNLAFPVDTSNSKDNIRYVFKGFGGLINYFTFYADGECVTHQVLEGSLSCSDIDSTRGFPLSYQMRINNKDCFNLANIQVAEPKPKKKRYLDVECSNTNSEPREKTYVRRTTSDTTTNPPASSILNPEEILLEDDDTMSHEPQMSFAHPTAQGTPVSCFRRLQLLARTLIINT